MSRDVILDLTSSEERKITTLLAECKGSPMVKFNEACAKVLKKRGIDNATTPFELTVGGPTATLTYREA